MVLTTHNEHLLLPLLSAVGRGDLSSEDIRIYFCKEEAGRAEAKRLDIDPSGRVEGGLPGFFEASLDELGAFISSLKANSE
jgi:predicted ATPase